MTNYDDCKKFCVKLVKKWLKENRYLISGAPYYVSKFIDFQADCSEIRVEPQIAEKIGIEDAPCYYINGDVYNSIRRISKMERVQLYFVDAKEGKFFTATFDELEKQETVGGKKFPFNTVNGRHYWHVDQFTWNVTLNPDCLAELRKFYTPEELGSPKPKTFKELADDYLAARQKYFDESQRDLKKLFECFWDGEQRG